MASLAEIEEFARRVSAEFRPERIILFGSFAYGQPTGDSDVDLLVVMPHVGPPWRTATEIRGRVRPTFPLDLLVRSREELARRIEMGDCFLREIAEKGRVVYEASHG